MRYKKWIKHLRKKFGHNNIHRWALTNAACPCHYLEWRCGSCGYDIIDTWCEAGEKFFTDFVLEGKKVIILKTKIL